MTEKEIIERIINDTPILRGDNSATQFDKVNALREWTYLNVPVVYSEEELTIEGVRNVSSTEKVPLNELLYLFEKGQAGVRCGGASATLRSIYRLFGFEAYEINIGDVGNRGTHVITLVKILNENKEIFSVQDAFYNYTLVDKENKPLDYFEVLRLLKAQQVDKLYRQEGIYKDKFALVSGSSDKDAIPVKIFENGNQFIHDIPSWKSFEDSMAQFFVRRNLPQNLLYLYLFPFGTAGGNTYEAQLILNQARRITESWCFLREGCLYLLQSD